MISPVQFAEASAPGKIILYGEHAVVYGQPAIAIPVRQLESRVTIQPLNNDTLDILIHAPDVNITCRLDELERTHPLRLPFDLIAPRLEDRSFPGLKVEIHSSIPPASGLGSGAAVTIALLRGLAAALFLSISDQEVSDFAFEVEKIHHGSPSGIDNTVIAFNRPVFFRRGAPLEIIDPVLPFHFLIADSGIKSLTGQVVGDVRSAHQKHPQELDKLFDRIGQVVEEGKKSIINGDEKSAGRWMNENHRLLQQLTVSCPMIDRLVEAALNSGALGAKVSGGGRGGNMIVLVSPENNNQIREALLSAGATRVTYTVLDRTGKTPC